MIWVHALKEILHDYWKGVQAKPIPFNFSKAKHHEVSFQDFIAKHNKVSVNWRIAFSIVLQMITFKFKQLFVTDQCI